ncbi:myelin-associated glycoprotein-like [Embiotoca jacksoni]|uniref:myelin-associated glycoprotein-like n=1 Tax=Embiotoca jacksoni TaxID=100190 RepID=UPI0037042897
MKGFRVMELKLWLSFLKLSIMHVAHDVQAIDWSVDIPSTIPAVEGSCLVIPCMYTYPSNRFKTSLPPLSGYWKKGKKIISSNLPLKLDKEYDQRTKLLGDLKSLNCTMLMSDVRATDIGPFHFRIVIPGFNQFSFINNRVSINVTRIPDPPSLTVMVGKKVSASCSVIHSCPTMPPQLTWNHAGAIKRRLKKLDQWKWETVTTLIFRPSASDFKKPLNCTVIYSGGKRAMSSTILKRLKKNWKA